MESRNTMDKMYWAKEEAIPHDNIWDINLIIVEFDIISAIRDEKGWYYQLKNDSEGYIDIDESIIAHEPFAFSPQCALMKYIVKKQDDMNWYLRECDSMGQFITDDLELIHQAKELLEKYL